jgi:uncharacterized protein DUF3570
MRLQLGAGRPVSPLREKIGKAALAVTLLNLPAAVHADNQPTTQIDINTLLYDEQTRAQVVEPLLNVTRLYADGQSLTAQFGLDVITGASPSGALPSGSTQTTTTASGQLVEIPAGEIPTTQFNDQRFGLDGNWNRPWNHILTTNLGGHFSHEKDYQSLGINGKVSFAFMHRLLLVDVGGGLNHDSVFPTGGTPIGLSDGTILIDQKNPKDVTNLVFGISRVITRRWLLGLDASRTHESGYLTEPYKIISVVDPLTGIPLENLTDKRPTLRDRTSLLFSSAYHFKTDVLYVSYRHYWDTWNLKSNTYDAKYRHDLTEHVYLEPHLRYYKQTPASFYTVGLISGEPLADFATADYRLGPLKTITAGVMFGLSGIADSKGEWTIRAEYIRQTGDSFPTDAVGVQKNFDLFPPINTFAVVVGYSFGF